MIPKVGIVVVLDVFFVDRVSSGQAAGIIVDTPSSFGSGPAANDHRQKLIRACIDAFRSRCLLLHFHRNRVLTSQQLTLYS